MVLYIYLSQTQRSRARSDSVLDPIRPSTTPPYIVAAGQHSYSSFIATILITTKHGPIRSLLVSDNIVTTNLHSIEFNLTALILICVNCLGIGT